MTAENGLGTSRVEPRGTRAAPAGQRQARAGKELARAERDLRRCPAGEGIEVLQEKWVLHIVHALLDGPKGFNELGRVVGGCNPTTLTQRLSKLEELGVLHREPGLAGGRCSYSLTEAGLGLERVIAAIRSWAAAHLRDASTREA